MVVGGVEREMKELFWTTVGHNDNVITESG